MYFGHLVRGSAGRLALKVMEGAMDRTRPRGAPRKQWMDNIQDWSGKTCQECKLLAQDQSSWTTLSWKWCLSVAELLQRNVPKKKVMHAPLMFVYYIFMFVWLAQSVKAGATSMFYFIDRLRANNSLRWHAMMNKLAMLCITCA